MDRRGQPGKFYTCVLQRKANVRQRPCFWIQPLQPWVTEVFKCPACISQPIRAGFLARFPSGKKQFGSCLALALGHSNMMQLC